MFPLVEQTNTRSTLEVCCYCYERSEVLLTMGPKDKWFKM